MKKCSSEMYQYELTDPVYLKIGTCYKKIIEKCLEAENIPLTDLLFYILEVLDPYRYKSSH